MTLPGPTDDRPIFGFMPAALRRPDRTGDPSVDWCAARFGWWRAALVRIGEANRPGGDAAALAAEVRRFAAALEPDAHPLTKALERLAELVGGGANRKAIGACLWACRSRVDEAQAAALWSTIPDRHAVASAGPPADWRSEAQLERLAFPILDPRHRLRDVAQDVADGRRAWPGSARGEVDALLRALEPAERFLTEADPTLVAGARGPRAAAEAVDLDESDAAVRTRSLMRLVNAWDAVAERLVGEAVRGKPVAAPKPPVAAAVEVAPRAAGAAELRLEARVLVFAGEKHSCELWETRWADLERLAKARKPGQGPRAGCVELGKNAWSLLRRKLNGLRPGLADDLLERVTSGRYRFRHPPTLS